jgi:hypothetical protein
MESPKGIDSAAAPIYPVYSMKVIYSYKNFQANKCISHIGLGVSALNTCKVLSANGINALVWPIIDGNDLRQRLNLYGSGVTHVVIAAPWIPTDGIYQLCNLFPQIQFAVNCHSNVGFLQADTRGVKLIREYLDLEMASQNFRVAANSRKMTKWTTDAYGNPCVFLPNLYFLDGQDRNQKPMYSSGVLRVGAFGATRPQKNFLCAVGAAVELGYQLKTQTEIWVNTGRLEGGGGCILNAAKEMVANLPTVTLEEAPWSTWPQFRRLVGSMHLLFQPSDTESFNMVTADGIAEGVPSVTSYAIDWVPQHWKATLDDCFDMARIGRALLMDFNARRDGLYALQKYITDGLVYWRRFLGIG